MPMHRGQVPVVHADITMMTALVRTYTQYGEKIDALYPVVLPDSLFAGVRRYGCGYACRAQR